MNLYNASQSKDLVEVAYVPDLAPALSAPEAQGKGRPSMALGRGLRAKSIADQFASLNQALGDLSTKSASFYPGLLAAGRRDEDQILLPVSFNLLLIVGGNSSLSPQPFVSMDELRRRTLVFNDSAARKGEKLGFSPRWPDLDILFQWAQLRGVGFGEARPERQRKDSQGEVLPLYWDGDALESTAIALRDYVAKVNGSAEAEDAYAFKYLFAPGYQNVASGALLYTAMDSASFFLLPPLTRGKLDFGYFGESGKLAVRDDVVYAGILKKARGGAAARRFLSWFFRPQTQTALLERAKTLRLSESAFGIADGFSSLREVTEKVFPAYYADLAGRLPSADSVRAPETMPPHWAQMKEEFVLPWLKALGGAAPGASADQDFSVALEAYLDKHPSLR